MTNEKSQLTVRDARPDERDVVATLTRDAYAEYALIMAPEAWLELATAIESGLASRAPAQRIVAEFNGKVVGTALMFPANVDAYSQIEGAKAMSWPEIRLVAVDPQARSGGIARAMMEEFIHRAEQSGEMAIGIHTSRSMRAAIALYESMGFERAPEQDFQPGGAELVLGYRLVLGRERR